MQKAISDSKLKKLARLTLEEWSYLFQAIVLLPWSAVSLRCFGYKATLRAFSRAGKSPLLLSEAGSVDHAKKMARMVNVAARYGLYRAKCLCRSLVLLRLMRRNGLEGEMVLGARWEEEQFGAHAWVQLGKQVINDAPDIDKRFGPFQFSGDSKP